MFVRCTFVYPASLSAHYSIHLLPPPHSGYRLSVSFFALVRFPRPLLGDQCFPTDNSIILHAKTASDVLAQSASHLCEQITSYRKTDFIFEERWFRFFCSPTLLDPSTPRSISRFLLFLFLSFSFALRRVQWRTRLARLRLNDAILFLNDTVSFFVNPLNLYFQIISKCR